MSLQVHTSQIRYLKANKPDALDVTRMGNWRLRKGGQPTPGEIFAPSWELFKDCQAGKVASEAEYDERFMAEMRVSIRLRWPEWKAILLLSRAVLCCYEPYPEHCHRHLLRSRILPTLGAVDCGEITP